MNHILIAGFLGADPEVRFTPSGQKVTSLRVACSAKRAGKEETTWYRVTVWGDHFDKMMPFFKKGSPIMVSGELYVSEYVDKEGKTRTTLNVTAHQLMFSPFGRSEPKGEEAGRAAPGQSYADASVFSGAMSGKKEDAGFSDEETPF